MRRKSLSDPSHKEEIIARTQKIQVSSQRLWGRMNAHQMLCHLADSFRVTIGEKNVTPVLGFSPRKLIKWIALSAPMRWPKGVKTRPEVDQELGGTPAADFDADREELFRLLQRFTANPRDFQWHPHPMFGMMSDDEWMRWGYLHMDHHLRQFGE